MDSGKKAKNSMLATTAETKGHKQKNKDTLLGFVSLLNKTIPTSKIVETPIPAMLSRRCSKGQWTKIDVTTPQGVVLDELNKCNK